MMRNDELPPDDDLNPDEESSSESSIYDDPEIRALLDAGTKDTQPLFEFPLVEGGGEGTSEELSISSDTVDPEKAHALYYRKKERLLKKYLPKGPTHAKARKLIRDQVKLFLNEGKVTGRDSRQTYYHLMEEAVVTIQQWVDGGGSDLYALYSAFYKKNKAAGYFDA